MGAQQECKMARYAENLRISFYLSLQVPILAKEWSMAKNNKDIIKSES